MFCLQIHERKRPCLSPSFVSEFYDLLTQVLKHPSRPGGPPSAKGINLLPKPTLQADVFPPDTVPRDTEWERLTKKKPKGATVSPEMFRRLEEDARTSVLSASFLDGSVAALGSVLRDLEASPQVSEGTRDWPNMAFSLSTFCPKQKMPRSGYQAL